MKSNGLVALASGLALLALGAAGCEAGTCSLEARPSLEIAVVDAQGETVPVAVIDYTIDGGDLRRENCAGDCDATWAGSEEPGVFVLEARTPEGATGTAVAFVEETDDGCHVETQRRRITVE